MNRLTLSLLCAPAFPAKACATSSRPHSPRFRSTPEKVLFAPAVVIHHPAMISPSYIVAFSGHRSLSDPEAVRAALRLSLQRL